MRCLHGQRPRHPGKRQELQGHELRVKNQRLAAAGYVWAFCSLTKSPGARADYDRRKQAGDRHVAAQRNLSNRFVGMLFHCLQLNEPYDEAQTFPNRPLTAASLQAA
jgi:hypothetical protein